MTTDNDFFRLDQQQWFEDFVDCELSEMFDDTQDPQKFTFDDVPY